MQEREYLEILIQSLKKKLMLLNKIVVLNQEQREILLDETSDPESFEINVRDKEDLVQQIVAMDAGFEEVYARIKALMERDHAMYESELTQMRELIRQVMAKDAAVRVEEQSNYKLAQERFASVRQKAREMRTSKKVVTNYYQNMMKQSKYAPQYMDDKK